MLKSVEVPVGPYRALRLVIAGGLIELVQVTGATKTYASEAYDALPANTQVAGELIVSEEASSGIEVVLPGDGARGAQSLDILLHFDVVRSFSQDMTGVDRWVMHPQVTVEAVGELRGEVASGQAAGACKPGGTRRPAPKSRGSRVLSVREAHRWGRRASRRRSGARHRGSSGPRGPGGCAPRPA